MMTPMKVVRGSDKGEEEKKKTAGIGGKRKADNRSCNGGAVTRSSSNRRRLNESLVMSQSDELPKSRKAKSSSSSKGEVEAGKIAAAAAKDYLKSEGAPAGKTKTVVIEHCKQCNSFKTRAIQVKSGLEKGLPGITVLVNPEKPRRGCLEVREEDGKKFISLLDMKRPFAAMKALDMDRVISDIIGKMN